MAERIRAEFLVDVEPTVDSSAVEIVDSVMLSALTSNGMFPERWSVEVLSRGAGEAAK